MTRKVQFRQEEVHLSKDRLEVEDLSLEDGEKFEIVEVRPSLYGGTVVVVVVYKEAQADILKPLFTLVE